MWAWGKGLGCSPAAMSPAMCEMSAMSVAPTSSAISRKRLKSMTLGYAEYPQRIILGLCSLAAARTES